MRSAAGHRLDPLGELQRSPDPLAAIGGGILLLSGRKGKGEGSGGRGEGRERERKRKRDGEGEKGEEGERDSDGRVIGGDCLLFI